MTSTNQCQLLNWQKHANDRQKLFFDMLGGTSSPFILPCRLPARSISKYTRIFFTLRKDLIALQSPFVCLRQSTNFIAKEYTMDSNAESILQVLQGPTCPFDGFRDTGQEPTSETMNEVLPSDAGLVTEPEVIFHSKPPEIQHGRHLTISPEAALDFSQDEPCGNIGGATSVCNHCDHWVNGLWTREWEDNDPIARISLGNFTEIEARSGCIVCRFLCQTVSKTSFVMDNTRSLALELCRTSHVRSCKYLASGTILYEDEEKFQHHTQTDHKNYPKLAVFNKNDIMPDITKVEVNWARLRGWYTEISSTASKTSQSSSAPTDKNSSISDTLPKGFCLINVSEACLIETDGVQVPGYAALSYVWGRSDEEIITTTKNFESLKLPGRFRKKDVPSLFRDAFEVCSQLGLDYLWIDRICVVQDEEKRKSAQLEAMGRIYSQARLTVVSSEPHFINQGLPGVSQPRTSPIYLEVGDKVLMPRIHQSLYNSTWTTRGWTYQEGLLSENLLIFGLDMVYMFSRGSEKLASEGFLEFSYRKPVYISTSLVPQDEQYSDQVNEYSTRLLTFGSDKVNAFLGVLNTFGEHQYGLPHRILDQAMLWDYTYNPPRSGSGIPGNEFPSWSWASTVGRIEYRHLPSKYRPLFSLATWAIVELDETSNKHLIKVLDDLQPGEHSEALHHLNTIRSHISPLEVQTGYDPVAIAMAANLCERYRLIQDMNREQLSNDSDTGPTAGENKRAESIWHKMIGFCLERLRSIFGSGDKSLSQVSRRMKPFKKAPWFQNLDDSIRQVPEQVRVETLLRIAKPWLPDLIRRLSAEEVQVASKPGRIVVEAPRKTVQLKYTQLCFEGTHIWMIGYRGNLIGMAELSEPSHQELLASMSQSANQDKVEAHCVALSLMACRVNYTKTGRQDYSNTYDSHSTVFAMVVSMPSMSCSHRLGLGLIPYSNWSSLGEVPIETTILS